MKKRPNVLFIFSDQQRFDTVSCYGEPLGAKFNLTPNLDNLASEGTRFDNAFTCQPVCGPARACIQTGKYPTEIGCHVNDKLLPLNERSIAHHFNEAGYETAYVGKWHLASEGTYEKGPNMIDNTITAIPTAYRGGYKDFWIASDVLEFTSHGYGGYMFDKNGEKREFDGYRVDATTDFALEYLSKPKDAPFFMFISYIEPHHQNDRHCFEGPNGSKEQFKDFTVPGDLVGTLGDWQTGLPDYLGCCRSLDDNVGRLVDCLKSQGIYEDTIIFYTADHGSHFCTRNSEYKRSCHDSSLHIPLIVKGGVFNGGHVISELVSLVDYAPTLLAAGEITPPNEMSGQPIQKLMAPDSPTIQEDVFVQISESCIGRAIRTIAYTYCVEAVAPVDLSMPNAEVYKEAYLYDNRLDPYQRNNLIDKPSHAELRKVLKGRLLKRIKEVEGLEPHII